MLTKKRLSILGDSISTYRGVSNDGEANATICDNPYRYREPFPMEGTYWGRLLRSFGMTLCVNNSWSGGNLSGVDDPTSGVSRARYLSRESGERPDLVIVFMGINDLGRRVDAQVFASDYEKTLEIIGREYPEALVCCVNIPDRDPVLKPRAEVFNGAIARAVLAAGERFFIADLFGSRLNNTFYYDNTVDGLHPDEDGMRFIAEIVEGAIRSRLS